MSCSNVNSQGLATDHEGECLEYGVLGGHVAPFAVSGDVFRELISGSEQFDDSHLETSPLDGIPLQSSSSGGIPLIERVEIEDLTDVVSDDEAPAVLEPCQQNTSSTIHAVLKTSKHEREELYRARQKLSTVLTFMRNKGFSEKQMLEEMNLSGSGPALSERDEFGLPICRKEEDSVIAQSVLEDLSKKNGETLGTGNPFIDKMKDKVIENSEGEMLGEKPKGGENLKDSKLKQGDVGIKSGESGDLKGGTTWANVLKKEMVVPAKFSYFPPGKDASVIEPPIDVLKQGNEKYKFAVVGTFTKGTKSFKEVADFAYKMWGSKGLLKVLHRDNSTFVLKFDSAQSRDIVLSRGTWYVGRRPMVVTRWGVKPGKDCVDSMPLWIKLSNVPDSYWTEEGLSRLASAIGNPIGADPLTSKLDILPFAKVQVLYKLGDPMPEELSAVVLDPFSEEKSVVKVSVSYPVRPLFCSGCKSLGHSVGACPKVNRIWVKKDKSSDANKSDDKGCSSATNAEIPTVAVVESLDVTDVNSKPSVEDNVEDKVDTEEQWHEVKRKHSSPTELKSNTGVPDIPPIKLKEGPSIAAGSLPLYAALSRTLSKSQRKKARQSGGKNPPQKH